MKRKLTAAILVFAMTMTCWISAFAADLVSKSDDADLNKISIAFRIGDSTLKVNGSDVTVTTPYESNGTTLVPLRVITEAFGAEVEWNEAEESVTLAYRDVTIKIWIGRTDAMVNNQTMTLLLAPELTNDTTMVPLRFITENFGADVSYDAETEAILVEKYITETNSIMDYAAVLHNTEKAYVGDSHLGWKMKYNKELKLASRSFAGESNFFLNDENTVALAVIVTNKNEEKTIDSVYEDMKENASKYTIIEQEKKKDASGSEYLYFELKSADTYLIQKMFIKDARLYVCSVYIQNDAVSEKKADYIEICNSYTGNFAGSGDTEDLSDVKGGYRTYENKEMLFKVDVPAGWSDISNKNVSNRFEFLNSGSEFITQESISITIVSADGTGLSTWVQKDRDSNSELFNAELFTVSDIQPRQLHGISARYYTISKEMNDGQTWLSTDLFFQNGKYIYNINVEAMEDSSNAVTEHILNSFVTEELDPEKTGKLMRPSTDVGTQTVKCEDYSFAFDLPSNWKYEQVANNGFLCTGELATISITVLGEKDNYPPQQFLEYVVETLPAKNFGNKIEYLNQSKMAEIGGQIGYYTDFIGEKSNLRIYNKYFVFEYGGNTFLTELFVPEELHSERLEKIFSNSLSFKGI